MNTDDEGCYYRAKWKIGRKELNSVVWAAERWGRYSIMFFIHPTSLRHLHIMYMRSLPRNQNFQKCGKYIFVLFIVFTLKILYYTCPTFSKWRGTNGQFIRDV